MEIRLQFSRVARATESFSAADLIDEHGTLRREKVEQARMALKTFKDISFELSSESSEKWQQSNLLIRELAKDLLKEAKHPYSNIFVFKNIEFQNASLPRIPAVKGN
jgi:hypothetical protein